MASLLGAFVEHVGGEASQILLAQPDRHGEVGMARLKLRSEMVVDGARELLHGSVTAAASLL
jgi:hypothetical protein